MLVSLCSIMGTSASAAANVTTVTMQSGDTVLGLCQKLGVDFYTYKNLIMTLNGFTSESQFSKLAVGQQIVLPSSAAAAAALAGGTASATTIAAGTTTAATTTAAATTAAAAASASTVGQVTSIPAGDHVAYYLVSYTIQKGETIQGIYSNWGLSYKTYDNQIKKLNNITSYSSIAAGKTMLLPTTNPAVANSSYYTVMAHTMKSGDSAYDIISNQYGMSFSANQNMILALNNTTDLAKIWAGSTLYIPVNGVVTASTSVSTSTAATTTTATVSTAGTYNLVSQTAVNGSFDMIVNGSSVTTAQAGKTVKVVATPNTGYTLDTIKVVKVGDASTVVGVSDGYFTMPSYSVVVSVSFKAAKSYNVTVDSSANGSAAAMVNGAQVTKAYVGNTVTVKTIPATGFMLDYIRVTYNDYKDSVAVYNNTFVMPDCDVTISAVFAKDPDYDPSLGHTIYTDVNYGTVKTFIGNYEVNHANKGDRVTIEVTPNTNYTLESLSVFYDNFKKSAEIDNGSFTMPDGPVTIVATIKPTSSATFAITKVDTTDGKFGVYANDTSVSEAKVGTKLTVKGTPKSAAYWYIVTVTKTGDSSTSVPVTMNEDGTSTFTMPDFPVSVRARFYLYHKIILDASNGVRGSFAVRAGNSKITKCASGVELNVNIWGVKKGYAASNIILTYADGSSHTLDGSTFIMPDCDVKVNVVFSEQKIIVAHAATVNGEYGKFGNTYTVGGKTLNGNKAATVEVKVGTGRNVVVYTSPAFGYEVDTISIAYTDIYGNAFTDTVGINPVTGQYQFEMPELMTGTKLNLYVSFKTVTTYAVTLDYAADNNKSHKKGTFVATTLSHTAYVDNAKAGEIIMINAYPAEGYAIDNGNIKVINQSTGSEVTINKNNYTFVMPAAPVKIIVPFYETSHYIQLLRANDGTDGMPKGVLSVIIDGVEYQDQDLIGKNTSDNGGEYDYDYSKARIKFPIGTLVTVVNSSRPGYVLNSEQPIVINKVVDGTLVNYKTIDGDHFSFEMPNADVVISAQYIDDMVAINAIPSEHGSYSVPLQVAWNGKFSVTEIVPDEGYELDKIVVNYISHNGDKHDDEVLSGTTLDLSKETGMLLSDIDVEVFFKPAINPMSIKYIFDDTPDEHSNYKVDLLVDGKKVEGLNRGEPLDITDYTLYTDHLYKFVNNDTTDELTGYGIQTGKTVVIKRNESKLDENFQIANIWLMHGEVAIKPEYSNNQYYFTMPYVSSGSSEELTLFIEYAKTTSDSFALSAYKSEGEGEISSWQFYVDEGSGYEPKNHATVKANAIRLEIIVPDYCKITDDTVIVRYTDSDGVAHPNAAELAELEYTPLQLTDEGGGKFSFEFDNTDGVYPEIGSMPQAKAVTVEYKVDRMAYSVDSTIVDADGNDIGIATYYVNGKPVDDPDTGYVEDEVTWGKMVSVSVEGNTGYTLSGVKVYGATSGLEIEASKASDGKYQFIMPKEDIYVVAEAKAVATVAKFENTSDSPNVHAVFIVGGTEYTDQVAVADGTEVQFYLVIPDNYSDPSSVYDDGSNSVYVEGPDAYGMYSFWMEDADVIIKADDIVEKEYTMSVVPDATGLAGVSYTVVSSRLGSDASAEGTHSFGDVHVGDTFTIVPDKVDGEVVHKIKKCTVTYRDLYGNAVNEPVSIDADGNASFRINYIPRAESADDIILVIPVFVKDAKATYSIIYLPNVQEAYKMTAKLEDSEVLKAGTTVTISMQIKYYLEVTEAELNSDVSLTYQSNGTSQEVTKKNIKVGKAGDKQYYTCSFSFKMPEGDVTVSVGSGFAATKYTEVKTTGTTVYAYNSEYVMKSQNSFDMSVSPDAYVRVPDDVKTYNVVISYKDENENAVTYRQSGTGSLEADGNYYLMFTLDRASNPDDPGNTDLIPLGGKFNISVELAS